MWLLGKGVQKSFVNCLDAVHAGSECIGILSYYYLSADKALQISQWNNSFTAGAYRLPVACWDHLSSLWWHRLWGCWNACDLLMGSRTARFPLFPPPWRRWRLGEGCRRLIQFSPNCSVSLRCLWEGESVGESRWRARAAHCYHARSASGAGVCCSDTV